MVKTKKDIVREAAEADLETFIRLVHPGAVLGHVHTNICKWWTREDAKSHQLILMPRDHQKSRLVGYRAAWTVIRNPAVRILYVSSTSNLAVKQLKFIKDILTSDVVRFYWPELVNIEEAKREKWTETEISVDHPLRKAENVRDPTIFTAGLTTTITGLHADIQILDDVVVKENAYTEEGRGKVEEQYSLLASIASAEGQQWVVGTRYHPKDLYDRLVSMKVEMFTDEGEPEEPEDLYEVQQYTVETRGDGSGEFLWPRQQRADGKWFGFDRRILAKKYAQYLDKVQFHAQYYNNPNDPAGAGIDRSVFQYYDRSFVSRTSGYWYYKNNRLNVFAAVDFAYSLKAKSDYTSIVVVGIDAFQNIYVLDIDRFKTDQPSEYFKHILLLHQKWDFRTLRAEVTAAQVVIVNGIKDLIRQYGLALAVKDFRPTRQEGAKAERIKAILQPRYDQRSIWHYQGGHCQSLEEELILSNPPHDDIKDCLASVIEICIAPSGRHKTVSAVKVSPYHARFGGVM